MRNNKRKRKVALSMSTAWKTRRILFLFVIVAACIGGFQCAGWGPRPFVFHQNNITHLSLEQIEKLKAEIKRYYKAPYRWGGTDIDGADCSGFVYSVYRNALGVNTPRTAAELYDFCVPIPKRELQFGDLVFFGNAFGKPTHVGLYVDRGYFLDATRSKGVALSRLNDNYYKRRYKGSGRVRID